MTGSLLEKSFVEINGVRQGMFITSRDTRHPVLLFVHGGPGMPEYWLTQRYPTGLDEFFTVVWWDQRGAGLSYGRDIPPATMTAGQLIEDTLEVTEYLRVRFGVDAIYLLGHSWGSFVGIQAVFRAPHLYSAYIGAGQVVHQLTSERLAYDYALAHFERVGDRRMLRKLRSAPPGDGAPLPRAYLALRDEYMHAAGIGTMRDMTSVISGLFLPSWRFRHYTMTEKVDLWRGKLLSQRSGLWDAMLATDLRQTVRAVEVPVVFLHGRHDYTCAYPLARAFSESLRAPLKRFHTFEKSAHSPMFEEPERTVRILRTDLLAQEIHSDPAAADEAPRSLGGVGSSAGTSTAGGGSV